MCWHWQIEYSKKRAVFGQDICAIVILSPDVRDGERYNFSDCQSKPGDRLSTEKSIISTYKFLCYTYADMTYSNPDAQINCIEVRDQKENGTSGYTSIVSGGVWHNNVTLHFEW